MRDLSEAIFERVEADEAAIRAYHAGSSTRQAMTQQELEAKGANYWNRRARRLVRAPQELKGALRAALDKYATCVDPMSGKQLLTPLTEQLHSQVVRLIDNGCFCGEPSLP
jgi:hypothetical protein